MINWGVFLRSFFYDTVLHKTKSMTLYITGLTHSESPEVYLHND